MNDENLRPFNERTESERREIARQGGLASGRSRQARKLLKDQLLFSLGNSNIQNMICDNLISKAIQGDIRAFEVIRDTIGENPKLQYERAWREEQRNEEQRRAEEKAAQKKHRFGRS
jgi:hypothetical protein